MAEKQTYTVIVRIDMDESEIPTRFSTNEIMVKIGSNQMNFPFFECINCGSNYCIEPVIVKIEKKKEILEEVKVELEPEVMEIEMIENDVGTPVEIPEPEDSFDFTSMCVSKGTEEGIPDRSQNVQPQKRGPSQLEFIREKTLEKTNPTPVPASPKQTPTSPAMKKVVFSQIRVEDETMFKCELCRKVFKYSFQLADHAKKHSELRKHSVQGNPNKQPLNRPPVVIPSISSVHKSSAQSTASSRVPGTVFYQCPCCKKRSTVFLRFNELEDHLYTLHNQVACHVCLKTFHKMKTMTEHVLNEHGEIEVGRISRKNRPLR